MNPSAMTGIPSDAPMNLAQVLTHNFGAQRGSDVTPSIFIVDEEASERESLELLICSKGWEPQTFASLEQFLSEPSALVPSCLVLNVPPDCNSLEIQKRFATERPEMPIILITSCGDVRMAVQAMKAGAIEFLTKPIMEDVLLSAIRQALERSRVALARQAEMQALKDCFASLTHREREVMALVVSGMLNKEVGGELGISEITVKAHRGKMMRKMKADSFAQLVKMAARLRLSAPKISAVVSPNCISAAVA